MGNLCQCQKPELQLDHQEVNTQHSKVRQESVDNDNIFSELIQQHSSLYQYQNGLTLTSTKPLSPRSQHQIVFLEPKDLFDERINYQPIILQGILASKSDQQEFIYESPQPEANGKEKIKKKVNFLK
ncbi:unnamed protein product (macronuclear) [Paramecium tetraurelia]|uniref:Uncharacterized protein n=1 Tax=Paramecium tetraurelia TaxID=5888 RepID=A0C2V0_PARTE|nr:uncharacterized protein GSPATT00034595001 [Paramecium tetraurelia]CAK65117.1 unnamed protein product [Paramecium tetraurelia]|eukprot:XP_001432514.1 hypothetical protein (macronuclear) [Paramecium tetraurelia strain d4-2]